MIKAILFDLWNTLIYNKSDYRPSVEMVELLKEHGFDNPDDTYDKLINLKPFSSTKEAAEHICSKAGCKAEVVKSILDKYSLIKPTPFPEVIPALKRLRRSYKLALVSNIHTFSLRPFRKTGFDSLLDYTFYSFELGMIKQNPELFRHALREMGVRPEEAVMVGDCKFADIEPAESAGIRGVLIKRQGFQLQYVEKETFNRTIKSLDELDRFLKP